MVTETVETDLESHGPGPIIKLKYLHSCQIRPTSCTRLKGLDESVVPAAPVSTTYQMKVRLKNGETMTRIVKNDFR